MIVVKLYNEKSLKEHASVQTEKIFSLYALKHDIVQSGTRNIAEMVSDKTAISKQKDGYIVFGLYPVSFPAEINFTGLGKTSVPGVFSATLHCACSMNTQNHNALANLLFALQTTGKTEWSADDLFSLSNNGNFKLRDCLVEEIGKEDVTGETLLRRGGACLNKVKIVESFPAWVNIEECYIDFSYSENLQVKTESSEQADTAPVLSEEEQKAAERIKQLNAQILDNKFKIAERNAKLAGMRETQPIKYHLGVLRNKLALRTINGYARIVFWCADHPVLSFFVPILIIALFAGFAWGYSFVSTYYLPYRLQIRISNVGGIEQLNTKKELRTLITAVYHDNGFVCSFVDSADDTTIMTEEIRVTRAEYAKMDASLRNCAEKNPGVFSMKSLPLGFSVWDGGLFFTLQKKEYQLTATSTVQQERIDIGIAVYGENELRNSITNFLARQYAGAFTKRASTAQTIQFSVQVHPAHETTFRSEIKKMAGRYNAVCGTGNPIVISAKDSRITAITLDMQGLTLEQVAVIGDVFGVSVTNEAEIASLLNKDSITQKMLDPRLKKLGLSAEWNASRDKVCFRQAQKYANITFIGRPPQTVEQLLKNYPVKLETGKHIYTFSYQTQEDLSKLVEQLDLIKELRKLSGNTITYEVVASIILNVEKLSAEDRLVVGDVLGISFLAETEIPCDLGRKSVDLKLRDRRLLNAAITHEWENGKLIFSKVKVKKEVAVVIYGAIEANAQELLKRCTVQHYEGKSVYTYSYYDDQERKDFLTHVNQIPSLRRSNEGNKNEFIALKHIIWRAPNLPKVEKYIKEISGGFLEGYFTDEMIQNIKDGLKNFAIHEEGSTISIALPEYLFTCKIRLSYDRNFDELKKAFVNTEIYKVIKQSAPRKDAKVSSTFVEITISACVNDVTAVKNRIYEEILKIDDSFPKRYISVSHCE